MREWLVKVKHYRGGESVIADFDEEGTARWIAGMQNTMYQTDNYYVERNRNFE